MTNDNHVLNILSQAKPLARKYCLLTKKEVDP
jgi:hypothetical protein